MKIASAEELEELKRLNQMFADILCQLRGTTTNINQIARKLHPDGEIPNDSMLYFLNKNILKYRKESERIWQLVMIVEAIKRYKKMWDEISQMFLIGSLSGITVLGDVTRKYLPVNLILLFILINMGIMLLRIYLRKKFDYM